MYLHVVIIICYNLLTTRLLCETQDSPSPVGHLASLEPLDTPPSLPDKRSTPGSPLTPSQRSLQVTPLSHLHHNVFSATDFSTVINAAHLRQDQDDKEKQPSLIDSQVNRQSPLSPVSIVKNRTHLLKKLLSFCTELCAVTYT